MLSQTKLYVDTGKEERIKRQTFIKASNLGCYWESSAPSDKPFFRINVCLPILPFMLAVFVGYSVHILLTDHLNLVLSEPL